MSISATVSISSITATASFPTQSVSGGDTTPPTFSVAPASASVDSTSFNITATLDEWGTVYSLVQAAATAAPSIATVISTGESAIDTGSGVTISHTGLTASTDYTAYVVAKDDDGNTQSSLTEVDVTTLAGVDADAATWIAAGSFSASQQTKIDTFVLSLKTGTVNGTNVWSDIISVNVLIWANATNNAINGKNPGTFDLTFVNSPTHGVTGVTFNGTTQYARTGIQPSIHTTLNDVSLSAYRTSEGSGSIIESFDSSSSTLGLLDVSTSAYFDAYSVTTGSGRLVVVSDSINLLTGTRRASNDFALYLAATEIGSATGSNGTRPAGELYVAARNTLGTAGVFDATTYKIVMVGNGLTSSQIADWNAAVNALIA